jgi:hypothetical protein
MMMEDSLLEPCFGTFGWEDELIFAGEPNLTSNFDTFDYHDLFQSNSLLLAPEEAPLQQEALTDDNTQVISKKRSREDEEVPSTNDAASSGKRRKQQKDKKKPLRSPNAFMLFSADQRGELLKQHRELSNSEISKLLGQKWRTLHPDKKKIYRDQADALKAKALAEISASNSLPNSPSSPLSSPSSPVTPLTPPSDDMSKKSDIDLLLEALLHANKAYDAMKTPYSPLCLH